MKEIWKDIVGYEGRYQVSNLGNVKSLDRVVINRWGNMVRNGAMMKPSKLNRYYNINLMTDGKLKCFKVHRLIAIAFIPNELNLSQVNHKDGDRYNNNVNNLEWVTQSENMQHAKRMGLRPDLTEDQTVEIKNKYLSTKITMSDLAKEYNVSKSTICGVVNNYNWKNKKAA